MCVIIQLLENQVMDMAKLSMAAVNNPHGYGLVIKDGDKLETIKRLPKGGNNENIEEIMELLDDHQDKERFLHLRYSTAGGVSDSNLHPFTVFNKDGHEIQLMHNGTMYRFQEKDSVYSDTFHFCQNIVRPLLDAVGGDISKPIVHTVLGEFIGSVSRVCLISNKYPTLFFGDWKEVECCNKKIKCSNDDYFTTRKISETGSRTSGTVDTTYRGQQQKSSIFEYKRGNVTKMSNYTNKKSNSMITQLKDVNLGKSEVRPMPKMGELLKDPKFHESNETIALSAFLTREEIEEYVKHNPKESAVFIETLTLAFNDLLEDVKKLEDKHAKASKKIEELVKKEAA